MQAVTVMLSVLFMLSVYWISILMKMTTERDLRNQMAYARKEAIAEGLAGILELQVAELEEMLQ